jgi:hypothetical protein
VDHLVKGKADALVLVPKWCLAWEGGSNSVTGSWFVAKCLNVIANPSFENSVTGFGFGAKCSNILQDITLSLMALFDAVSCLSGDADAIIKSIDDSVVYCPKASKVS